MIISMDSLVEEKAKAIQAVYHRWGLILKNALKEAAPKDQKFLVNSIQFRVVMPRSKSDLTGKITLMVGILKKNSPALEYLKFILYGTSPHFVPVKYTSLTNWMVRHGLVTYGKSGKQKKETFRWKSGKIYKGTWIHGNANNFFERVYTRYASQINSEVRNILEGK